MGKASIVAGKVIDSEDDFDGDGSLGRVDTEALGDVVNFPTSEGLSILCDSDVRMLASLVITSSGLFCVSGISCQHKLSSMGLGTLKRRD